MVGVTGGGGGNFWASENLSGRVSNPENNGNLRLKVTLLASE